LTPANAGHLHEQHQVDVIAGEKKTGNRRLIVDVDGHGAHARPQHCGEEPAVARTRDHGLRDRAAGGDAAAHDGPGNCIAVGLTLNQIGGVDAVLGPLLPLDILFLDERAGRQVGLRDQNLFARRFLLGSHWLRLLREQAARDEGGTACDQQRRQNKDNRANVHCFTLSFAA
jgi:hypothetical protein